MNNSAEGINPLETNAVLQAERVYFGLKAGGDEPLSAICLSGGGIRSATFSLGVLQGLAERRLLTGFHYLSSVSGGGYIASWLSRWIHESNGGTGTVQAALSGGGPEPGQIRNLRSYSNYLSPVWGMSTDFFTLVSIFLRNLLLNWMMLLPLIGALVLLPRLYVETMALSAPSMECMKWILGLAGILLVLGIGYIVADLPEDHPPATDPEDRFALLCFTPILFAALLLGLLSSWEDSILFAGTWWLFAASGAGVHVAGCAIGLAWRINYGTGKEQSDPHIRLSAVGTWFDMVFIILSGAAGGIVVFVIVRLLPEWFPWFNKVEWKSLLVVPVLLFSFWLATTVYVALSKYWTTEGEREWWARSGGWWLRTCLGWIIGFGLVIWLPMWLLEIPGADASALASAGGMWGVIVGLIGYWSKSGTKVADRAKTLAAATGARLLDLAALVFIVLVLAVASIAIDAALRGLREPAYRATASESKATSFREVETAARILESDARAVDSITRAINHPIKDGKENDPKLVANAKETAEKTSAAATSYANAAANLSGNAAEALEAVNSASRTLEIVAKSYESAIASVKETREPMVRTLNETLRAANLLENQARGLITEKPEGDYTDRLVKGRGIISWALFGALLVAAVLASFFVGVNTFSLHAMYGNRLVRAYLGAVRQNRRPHWFTGFDFADNIPMSSLDYRRASGTPPRLMHVVNLALNLVDARGSRLEWQQRKAASFTVSPLHAGSDHVGYLPTAQYSDKETGISLGRALTISGAAASPNMGYHSSAAVAFVMTFFNIRLGWWLPNPGRAGRDVWQRNEPALSLLPLLWEALGVTNSRRSYVYLSDGGHFDNLGLYEMVRRGCCRILVVDASADPKRGYDDLQDVMRKIRVDFGINIEFQKDAFKEPRRCLVGRVSYPKGTGILYYIKPVLCGDEPLDVAHYAAESRLRDAANPFPHQSTSDQFFDESQFESYRMLGQHTMAAILGPVPSGSRDTDTVWPSYEDPLLPCGDTKEEPVNCCCCPICRVGGSALPPTAEKGFGGDMLSSFTGAVQSIGKTALAASAITVGGILVGVTGTVALRDTSVSLKPGGSVEISKESLDKLAKTAIPVMVSGDSNEESREALIKALAELKNALNSHEKQTQILDRTVQLIDRLEKQIADGKINVVMSQELATLKRVVGDLTSAINGLPKPPVNPMKELVDINTVLERIDKKLATVPPRQNVRGTE